MTKHKSNFKTYLCQSQVKPQKNLGSKGKTRLNSFQSYILYNKEEQYASSAYCSVTESDFIDCCSSYTQKVLAFMFIAKKSLRKVYFSRMTIAQALGMDERTVARALKQLKAYGLISYLSGKEYYRTNLYFVCSRLLTKPMKKVMKKLLATIWDMAPKAWLEKCPTRLRYIILRVVYIYNKYINPKPKPEKSSNSWVLPPTFFSEKNKKLLFAHTHTKYIPKEKKDLKRGVYNSGSIESKPRSAILNSEHRKASMNKFDPFPDNNQQREHRRTKTPSCSMCPMQLADLKRSIAFYYGGYVYQKGDRIMPKKYVDMLKKKAGL